MPHSVEYRHDVSWDMSASHLHDYCAVLLVLSRGGSMLIDKELFPLTEGSLFIIPRGVLHMSSALKCTYDRYILRFPPNLLQMYSTAETNLTERFATARRIQLNREEMACMQGKFERCRAGHKGFGASIRSNLELAGLVVDIAELVDLHGTAEHAKPFAPVQRRVAAIVEYVHTHLADCLRLDTIAHDLYLSKYHLCRVFKEEAGVTLGEYILQCRLHHAQVLLRSGHSVQRAGEEAGFGDNAHFIRTFGRHVGVSPGRYAKQNG